MITIRNSELKDVRELSKTIREQDRQESLGIGFEPHKALYNSFRYGIYRKTGLIDNEIAAMWGVGGAVLSDLGRVYLVTGTKLNEISPLIFARLYRNEVQEMKKMYPILENYVDVTYEGAVRMLKIAGFTIHTPVFTGNNGHQYSRFSIGDE